MYATNYPCKNQGEAVGFVEAMTLNASDKKVLFEDVATRIFRL